MTEHQQPFPFPLRLVAAGGVCVLAFILLLVLWTRGGSLPDDAVNGPKATLKSNAKVNPATSELPVPASSSLEDQLAGIPTYTPPERVVVAVHVNWAPHATVTSDLPVLISCVLSNSTASDVPLPSAHACCPEVRDGEGMPVKADLTAVRPLSNAAPARGTITGVWHLATSLAPGTYNVVLPEAEAILPAESETKVVVRQATLEIRSGSASEAERAYGERRLLMAQGNYTKLEKRLRQRIAEKPKSVGLRRELADCLESAGQYENAKHELLDLASVISTAEKDSGKRVELPCWIPMRIEMLDTRMVEEKETQ